MRRPDAIIFDLGGTLATREDWTGALERSLDRMGIPCEDAEAVRQAVEAKVGAPEGPMTSRRRLGRHRQRWAAAALEAAGVTDGLPARTALLRRLLETETLWRPPHPEVPEMLDRLTGRYRLAVASNNDGRTREKLAALGLAHPFEAILDSQEEKTAKPDPDLLVATASRLALMPFRCVYVGNDPHMDVVAARAAGMPVVWVDREGVGPGEWRPNIHLPDLSRLPEALEETFGS
jgi:HAD superfamily hydrolase (TIGR01509 family)